MTGALDALRHEPLRTDPALDMASLDVGPLNRYQHLTSENTRALVESLAETLERPVATPDEARRILGVE